MRRSTFTEEVRARAIARPPSPPPQKAMAESAIVHCTAVRIKRNSLKPKGRIMAWSLAAERIVEGGALHQLEEGREADGEDQVDHGDDQVDLEGGEGLGLDIVADGREVVRRNGRDDARGEHQVDELAGERRIDRAQ